MLPRQRTESLAVFRDVDRFNRRSPHRNAGVRQRLRELQRSLSAKLHDHALGFLEIDDLQHILERQRLEVEPIGSVVVGRDCFGIAVDHDGLESDLAQSERRVHAAGIELDALADAIRPRSEDHDFAARGGIRFVLALIRRVQIRRGSFELRGASVDAFVDRTDPMSMALLAHFALGHARQLRDLHIRKSIPLHVRHWQSRLCLLFDLDDLPHLAQKPRIDERQRVDFLDAHAAAKSIADCEDAIGPRRSQKFRQSLGWRIARLEAMHSDLERPQTFLQRLVERAPDGHRLADRLHRQTEDWRRVAKFLECETRDLHDHVIDARLERRRRLARDVVGNLVECVTGGQLGRELRDGKSGRLRSQSRRARHARVHLDRQAASGGRMHRELNVRAAGLDADRADDALRFVAHRLIFVVGERLLRCDGDRVAGVHAHCVEVFDRADDDHVVRFVAHDLQLEFFPAQHRFLDQDAMHGRDFNSMRGDRPQLFDVVGDAASRPT